MWNCLKCQNESADTAEYCAYCGAPRTASRENAREIVTKPASPNTEYAAMFTSQRQATRGFPLVAPAVLRLSETTVRVIAASVGVLVGSLGSVAIYLLADPSGMTGKLFNLKEPSG